MKTHVISFAQLGLFDIIILGPRIIVGGFVLLGSPPRILLPRVLRLREFFLDIFALTTFAPFRYIFFASIIASLRE